MGFVNAARGVRAIGYLERDPIPAGPIALVTHSGSVFSAMLRTHRRLEYSLVVSSGQELVTTTADYLAYALSLAETRVVGLVLETMRDAPRLREGLADAAERDIPVVALTVGTLGGRPDPRRRALGRARGLGRRLGGAVRGVRRAPVLATWASSPTAWRCSRSVGGSDAARAGSPPCTTPGPSGCWSPTSPSGWACRSRRCRRRRPSRLAELLDPGLDPDQPARRVGLRTRRRGPLRRLPDRAGGRRRRSTWSRWPSTWCRSTTATTPIPEALATVGRAHRQAGRRAVEPVVRDRPAARDAASCVRDPGARRHPLGTARAWAPARPGRPGLSRPLRPSTYDASRSGLTRLTSGDVDALALLADYGVPVAASELAGSADAAHAAAETARLPRRTQDRRAPDIHHKVDVGRRPARAGRRGRPCGRRTPTSPTGLGPAVRRPDAGARRGRDRARGLARPAPRPAGPDRCRRHAGGAARRARRSPSRRSTPETARRLVARLRVDALLAGHRGSPPLDVEALVAAVVACLQLAHELGDQLEALDVNPLIVGPTARSPSTPSSYRVGG